MILDNSFDKDREVRRVLSRSLIQSDPAKTQAWMKYKYDPGSMFCYIDDKKITSVLQSAKRTFVYGSQKASALVLSQACTLPDYRQRHHFNQLLEACMNNAACNHLITLVYTTSPKLFETKSFQEIAKTKTYWLEREQCIQGIEKNVRQYRQDIDLYSLYTEFLSYFDGSILLKKEQFQKQIQYHLASNYRIAVGLDEHKRPQGFAVYKSDTKHTKVKILVYLNSTVILDLFSYLTNCGQSLSFTCSWSENFEQLFNGIQPRNQGSIMARLNNYNLFSTWCHKNFRHAKEAFNDLEKPSWNLLID